MRARGVPSSEMVSATASGAAVSSAASASGVASSSTVVGAAGATPPVAGTTGAAGAAGVAGVVVPAPGAGLGVGVGAGVPPPAYGQLAIYATCFIYILCFSYCHHHVSYFQESTSPGTLLLRDHPRDTHYLVLFQVRWLRLTALPNIKGHLTRTAP